MVERTLAMAAEAMHGRVTAGDPRALWSGALLDNRRLTGNELFFALPGERTDGHRFADDAARRAAGVVVHQDLEPSGEAAWIRVEDTFRALHDLTRAVRREVPKKLVGITGSAGKTTTKELLAAMLAKRFRTAKSEGNLNNLYGFPISLLAVPDDCEWMVAEMGMSTPGELGEISRLGSPDVAVFTNIRPVHLENFADLRAIAEAKAELLQGLAEGGLIVANADDPEVVGLLERHAAPTHRVVRYGFDAARADVRASSPRPRRDGTGCRFELTANGETVEIELRLHGLYNAANALAAAACAHALGVSLAEIAAAASEVEASSAHRGRVHRLAGDVTLIDDSYNSNPEAARLALESAAALRGSGRRIAILGDMLELGPRETQFHRDVGRAAAELGFAPVVGVGRLAAELADAAVQAGVDAVHLADADAARHWALDAVRDGDIVLIKGSRGIGLEIVAEALIDKYGEARGEVNSDRSTAEENI